MTNNISLQNFKKITMGSETLVSTIIRKSIMSHIMNSGSFVISDISEDTGYTATTVAKYVSKLIDEGLLSEVDRINLHSKGRKTVRYGISSYNRYFLGVDISAFEMKIGLMNLAGEIIKIEKDTTFRLENNYDTLDKLCNGVKKFVADTEGVDISMIMCANINLPGRVNSRIGTSASTFNFEETVNTPLAEILADKIGIPIYIENDTKAMAYGEYMSGLNKSYKNICYVNIGWGLGMALIVEGHLHLGKDGYSGELGHVHHFNNNVLCHCGKKGCLETELSGRAIVRKLTERILQGDTSVLSHKVKSGATITTDDIINAVKNEDALCIEFVSSIGTELGHQLSGIVNIFNPDVIVIGGSLSEIESYYFLQYTRLAIRQYSLKLISQDLPVISSTLGENAAIIGSCMIARSKILTGEIE